MSDEFEARPADYRYSRVVIATSAGPDQPSPTPRGILSNYFTLDVDGTTPVPEPSQTKWRQWIAHATNRVVARDELDGGTVISTVFTGRLTTAATGLWETRILGGSYDGEVRYYATRAAAQAGHLAMIANVQSGRQIRLRE